MDHCRFGLVLALTACSAAPAPAPAAKSPDNPPPAQAVRSAEPPPAPVESTPAAAPVGVPCGELGCLAFESAEKAFDFVLAQKPRVLGIGEAHAQQRDPKVHSSTRRFGQQLMPKLKGQATDIVIELMVGTGRCGKEREQAVAERQKPVTEGQAKPNQNEFVTLGHAAKAAAIAPHALEPSCEDYQAVLDAGAGDIARLLQLIADTTAASVEKLLDAPGADESKVILTYGGARHNDLTPRPQMEAWSFGPRLAQRTKGRYVELDLIVPEFIKDNEAWRALPWYSHYDAARLGAQAIVFRPEPSSYVLVFPRTP